MLLVTKVMAANLSFKCFEKNQDCDVLLAFVSEDSNTVNRKRHFDITYEDGRPTGHLDRRILS